MDRILVSLTALLYLVAVALALLGTARHDKRAHSASALVAGVGAVAHLVELIRLGLKSGQVPIANSGEFFFALGWVVVCLHLVVWSRWRIEAVGLVLPPLALLMLAGAVGIIPVTPQPLEYGSDGWFVFHIIASTLGVAAFGVAFAMSLIYLTQDRALKSKWSMRILERLPSLEMCDRVGHEALLWGFPLLTAGILTGIATNLIVNDRLWSGGVKETAPLLAWALFGGLLYARSVKGYRGRRGAYLVILGFALGLLSVLGMGR